jgi:hypothetical protein
MKTVTITLHEDVAEWLRLRAAEADQSMSAYVNTLLEDAMGRGKDQLSVLDQFLTGAGYAGISANLPKRDDLYDRPALSRHKHSDLRARSGQSRKAQSVDGFAEDGDQQSYSHTEPAKPE